jgi:acyl-CoA synthetase (AMP-forming)/AMP-acid ligase II
MSIGKEDEQVAPQSHAQQHVTSGAPGEHGGRPARTLVELLRRRAAASPGLGYTFLVDGERQEAFLSFQALDGQAQTVAAALQSRVAPGERALLLFPTGLAFLPAFFGCLYAGVLAIPAPMPSPSRLARTLPRLLGIL